MELHNVGGAGSADEKLGLIAVALPYTAPMEKATDAEQIAWCRSFIPDPYPFTVPIVRREFHQTVSGRWELTLYFDGHPDSDSTTFAPAGREPDEFELEGAVEELDIESHPNLETLLSHYEGNVEPNNSVKFPFELVEKDGDGKAFPNPMFGQNKWTSPGMVWTRHFVAKLFPADLLRQLGKVTGSVPGNPPKLWGKRAWICERITGVYRGNVWKISMSWRMSGPGGVVSEMFDFGD